MVELWSAALPFAAPLLDRIQSVDDLLINEIGRVRCRRYAERQAVIIGDAAHAMAPNLGQGANSALVDAAVLARELTAAPSIEHGLRRYDQQRRRPVTRVQRTSDLLATVSHLQHTGLRRVRDHVFRVAAHPGLVRRQIRTTQQVPPAELMHDVQMLMR